MSYHQSPIAIEMPHVPSIGQVVRTQLQRLGMAILRVADLQRQRDALAGLDARLLDDIGVSAEAAREEAAKPVWQR